MPLLVKTKSHKNQELIKLIKDSFIYEATTAMIVQKKMPGIMHIPDNALTSELIAVKKSANIMVFITDVCSSNTIINELLTTQSQRELMHYNALFEAYDDSNNLAETYEQIRMVATDYITKRPTKICI